MHALESRYLQRTKQPRGKPGPQLVNESYETARLAASVGDGDPKDAFRNALQEYADADGSERQVRLIEAVIRTSRRVCDMDSSLDREIRETMATIVDRYRFFASDSTPLAIPQTFRQARTVLQSLFF